LGVDEQRVRQVVGFGELEQAPRAHAVAVVAPGEAAVIGRRVRRRVVAAEALAEGKVLHVETEMHSEALAFRPAVVLALGDCGIVVASVGFQLHVEYYACRWTGLTSPFATAP